MNEARTRIGRVKLKGGADLHVFDRRIPASECAAALRAWSTGVLNCEQPPHAFAAVAFVFNPQNPASPLTSVAWFSEHPALITGLLPGMAGSALQSAMQANMAERHVMRVLGFRPVPPDDAS